MLIEHDKYTGYYYSKISENYLVNKDGNIISLDGKEVNIRRDGHPRAYLKIDGKIKTIAVSRIVAETFLNKGDLINPLVKQLDGDIQNNKVVNLMWLENRDIQLLSVKNKILECVEKYNIPEEFTSTSGLYPNPIEHKTHKGYYYIPHVTSPIVVNKAGFFINLTGEEINLIETKKGYLSINLRTLSGKYKQILTHRIIAMLFCEIPKQHENKSFIDLQVNHLDTDKVNNHYLNLEWCIGSENMKHARENNLFKNSTGVLAMNTYTEQIVEFFSISDCARKHNISSNDLYQHLYSVSQGRIPVNGWVFKLNNTHKWPTTIVSNYHKKSINYICDIVAVNVITDEKFIFHSIDDACEYLNLDRVSVNNHRCRKGYKTPFKNFVFYNLNEYLGDL